MNIKLNKKFFSFEINKDNFQPEALPTTKDPSWFRYIYLLILLISILAWIFYFQQGLTLSYNDARSHLNIARRVIDSLQPGFAQIGSVWLPLMHILEIPTIWNDFMYRTGLSGSIISILSFVGSSILIIKIIRLFKLGYPGLFVALLLFVSNPNMIFMQTLPMTESLMIFTQLLITYFFIRWAKYNQLTDLILTGVATFLAVLTRYDGWFMFGYVGTAIIAINFLRGRFKKIESNFLLYFVVGFFAVMLWIGWNTLIFGDPSYFITGEFSAKSQQDILQSEGRLLTKHDLNFSVYTYFLAMVENISLPLVILGIVGLLFSFAYKLEIGVKIALMTLIIPIIFNILSLYFGHSVIHLPMIPPYTWFNDRYGLMALPSIAIGAAFLINKRIFAAILVSLIIFTQVGMMYINNNVITIQDGVKGASGYFLDDIGLWLNQNATDGLILVAASSHDSLIFVSGLPNKRFITEGASKYWKESLENPTTHATYIIMHPGDLVYDKLHTNPAFLDNYQLVFEGQFSNVYKIKKQ